jgi:hypothetical protein
MVAMEVASVGEETKFDMVSIGKAEDSLESLARYVYIIGDETKRGASW